MINNKKIAIVGGGPGGLTLARLLQKNGAGVTVYERDEGRHVRVQGATLDLHVESGLKALKEAGLMDAFMENYRPGADMIRVTDKAGNILLDDHAEPDKQRQTNGQGQTVGSNQSNGQEQPKEESGVDDERFRPEIDRGPLREILLDSLQPDTVVWDSYLLSLLPVGGGWELQFQNGTTAFADIVIGADGANSKIRPFITAIKPFYSGVTVVEGKVYDAEKTVPGIHALLKGGKIFALGDEKSLIVSSKGDGSLVFYTGCKTDEHWYRGIDFTDRQAVINWWQQEYAGWDSVWMELFEQTALPFQPRPQYCMPPDQQWDPLPNLTMLGDAAHLMPPYAGEGVNMAMLDALELSNALTDPAFPDVLTAIAHYEKQMRARAGEVARMTLEQTEALHSAGSIEHLLGVIG